MLQKADILICYEQTRMGPTALKSFVKPFENDPIK